MDVQEMPCDSEDSRYIQSFTVDQKDEILQCFREYGVVIIRDVLTAEECERTRNDIIEIAENNSDFRYNDSSTWHNWPSSGIERYGQVQRDPYFTPQFMYNRQNPKVLEAFSILYNIPKEQLIVNHDRGCLFRPTKMNPSFKTQKNIHLDFDPWGFMSKKNESKVKNNLNQLQYGRKLNEFIFENNQVHSSMYNGLHLQAGINLLDNQYEDGGFGCVPGFVNIFDKWAQENSNSHFVSTAAERNSVQFPSGHWIYHKAQRLPMKEGSLIIWDQKTPHGSFPNDSHQFRIAQFLKVYPNTELCKSQARRKARRNTLQREIRNLGDSFTLSELGRAVFDL